MKNVQDIYPVSPVQEMMLLHALAQRDADTLFNQFCYRIDADLDVSAFEHAWRRIIERHDALRTAFVWEGIKQPQQVVYKSVDPVFTVLDWRAVDAGDLEQQFDEFLAQDRSNRFDPRRAPLMRFSLMRTGDRCWRFVWSSHHLVIDRWCLGQLYAEFDRFYFDRGREDEAFEDAPVPSFREYIAWIQHQDRASALAYWKTMLRGFDRPLQLVQQRSGARVANGRPLSADSLQVSGSMRDEIAAFARKHGLTSSTLFQGAWVLTMNRIAQAQDVVFGATVAGRPPGIPGVESIVGSFINYVPVRVQMSPTMCVPDWLHGIQTAQIRRTDFEYLAPGDIQQCSELAESGQLFDTLLVSVSGSNGPAGLAMRALSLHFATAFPLTVSVADNDDEIVLRADCRGECVRALPTLLQEFLSSLRPLLNAAEGTALGELPGFYRDASCVELSAGSSQTIAGESTGEMADAAPIDGVARGRERPGEDVFRELVRSEWAAVLGTADLPENIDFFELGGSSLQAAMLHTRIEKSTRQSLPLLALFGESTIAGMAKTLVEEDWPLLADLSVGLRTTGSSLPLFCIASPEVNAVGYSMLARHLPDSQNVYVLQDPPKSTRLNQLDPFALPAIAKRYVECMRRIHPAGPYRLLSMCDGSHIAMEMARTLEAENESIEFFGIVNTWGLYTISRFFYLNRFLNILKYYAGRVRDLLPQPMAAAPQAQSDTGHVIPEQQLPAVPAGAAVGIGNPWIKDFGFERCDPGRPKIATEVTLFRIKPQPFWRIRQAELGWSKQAESVNVIYLPCNDHYDIMRQQHIGHLAATIETLLGDLDAAALPAKTA